MKIITLFLLTLLWLPTLSANEEKTSQHHTSFLLNNINIVDVENKTILIDKALIIKNGKIDAIIDQISPLTAVNLTIIDGKNGYATPGLIDMHVHMYEKAAYILTLSHGITHVRIMNGVPKQLLWRDNISSDKQLGSTSTVSSPIISGYKDAYLHHGVETKEEAIDAVRTYQAMDYDLIKAYGNLNENALSAIISESDKLAIPVAKHGPHASGDMSIAMLGEIQSFEHVEDIFQGPLNYEFSHEKLAEILPALKASNVPITPTLNIYHQLTQLSLEKQNYLDNIEQDYTSDIIAFEAKDNQVKRWLNVSENIAKHNQKVMRFLQYITRQLNENGIPLLVGSDSGVLLSPHGLATHTEMQLLTEAGISNFDTLAAATINPAKALNLDKQLGKIAQSYNADFIFTERNPVDDLTILKNPEAVIKNGHWYDQIRLKKMREEAIASRSLWDEIVVVFEAI